jgi:hypothetical protein
MADVSETVKLIAALRDVVERHGRPISISSETGVGSHEERNERLRRIEPARASGAAQ